MAISGVALLVLALGAVVAVAFAGAIVWLVARRRPQRRPEIPSAMRPGPADEVLERRMVERFMGWNFLFVIFFAAWLPVLWLREPGQNAADAVTLTERSVERGAMWFAIADEENPTGFGCARCHGPAGEGGQTVPFQDTFVQPPRLDDVCGGEATGHPLIKSVDDVRATIEQGREGTAMPSWSINYEGPMNDQQIDDLINYLFSIQQLPQDAANVCLEPVEEETGGGDTGNGGGDTGNGG